jgi:cysteine desulfurase
MSFCYLDNNATTQVAPEVIEAMLPLFAQHWGNPSGVYRFGHEVVARLEAAREQVAALIHADPREVVFTSCGTESNNTAIQSALHVTGKHHVVTTAVEHPANLRFSALLRQRGCEVTMLPVDSQGTLDLAALEAAIRPDTALVSVMWANNETGVLFPVAEVASLCRRHGVLCHTDAVQMAGKMLIDAAATGVDALSLSAHKLHAPKGIGALYVRRGTRFQPYLVGGHQENGRRAGTENTPYIVGFGRAAELALARLADYGTRVRALRDRLEQALLALVPDVALNGAPEPRLPNTSNLAFAGIEAEALLMLLDQQEICASSGSACASGSPEPSHVLTAMGCSPARARGSVRFSLGYYSTDAEVDRLIGCLPALVAKLRRAAV